MEAGEYGDDLESHALVGASSVQAYRRRESPAPRESMLQAVGAGGRAGLPPKKCASARAEEGFAGHHKPGCTGLFCGGWRGRGHLKDARVHWPCLLTNCAATDILIMWPWERESHKVPIGFAIGPSETKGKQAKT